MKESTKQAAGEILNPLNVKSTRAMISTAIMALTAIAAALQGFLDVLGGLLQ